MKTAFFFLLLALPPGFPVLCQEIESPTPTLTQAKVYLTPDWDHLIRGYDYDPNIVTLDLKRCSSKADEKRVKRKMESIGDVLRTYVFPATAYHPKITFYTLLIMNRMTERHVIDILRADPAVDFIDLDRINQNPFGMGRNGRGLTPAPTPVPYNEGPFIFKATPPAIQAYPLRPEDMDSDISVSAK
jgi:hypothetical protein